ncbi:hypothetical protein MJO29_008415 [Puccinia striiformis f. sp. tritici]|nr:hypothetical protein MJO29_008415 [Puccinia striiformis f. sp. tritici]
MNPKSLEPQTVATKTPAKKKPIKKTPAKEAKKVTPAQKKNVAGRTPKKVIVEKEESESGKEEEEEEEEEEEDSSEEENTNDTKKKKKKKNHPWTDDQRVALLAFIHDQIALGKGTDNGNLKSEGWTAVRKEMVDRFEIKFDEEQLKNQKGAIRKLYVDLKFLKAQSGFGWNAATGMVTAENGTWKELIGAHPKRKFRSLCKMTIHWFDLAYELFNTSMANGEGAVLPGAAPPKDGGDKCSLVLTNSSDLSKNSVKRRQDLTKAIELDLSDDDEIAFKQSAPERSIVQKAERLIVRKAGRLIVQKAERLIVQSFHKLNERSFKQLNE